MQDLLNKIKSRYILILFKDPPQQHKHNTIDL